jgi:hypothetical protein
MYAWGETSLQKLTTLTTARQIHDLTVAQASMRHPAISSSLRDLHLAAENNPS